MTTPAYAVVLLGGDGTLNPQQEKYSHTLAVLVPEQDKLAHAKKLRDLIVELWRQEECEVNWPEDGLSVITGAGYAVLPHCLLSEEALRAHAVGPVGAHAVPKFQGNLVRPSDTVKELNTYSAPNSNTEHVYAVGDDVEVLPYRDPKKRAAVITVVQQRQSGIFYSVRRADGVTEHGVTGAALAPHQEHLYALGDKVDILAHSAPEKRAAVISAINRSNKGRYYSAKRADNVEVAVDVDEIAPRAPASARALDLLAMSSTIDSLHSVAADLKETVCWINVTFDCAQDQHADVPDLHEQQDKLQDLTEHLQQLQLRLAELTHRRHVKSE